MSGAASELGLSEGYLVTGLRILLSHLSKRISVIPTSISH